MGRVTVDICDGCGATRKSGNHWFRVAASDNGLTILPHDMEEPLTEATTLACGEKCVHHAVSAYLAEKDLPRADQEAELAPQPPPDELRRTRQSPN